jgi:hypothetical protein
VKRASAAALHTQNTPHTRRMLRSQLVRLAVVACSSMRRGVAPGVRSPSSHDGVFCSQKGHALASGSLETVSMFSTTISSSQPILVAFLPNSQLT